jgi:hypothetical protein
VDNKWYIENNGLQEKNVKFKLDGMSIYLKVIPKSVRGSEGIKSVYLIFDGIVLNDRLFRKIIFNLCESESSFNLVDNLEKIAPRIKIKSSDNSVKFHNNLSQCTRVYDKEGFQSSLVQAIEEDESELHFDTVISLESSPIEYNCYVCDENPGRYLRLITMDGKTPFLLCCDCIDEFSQEFCDGAHNEIITSIL